jgi:phytanoyl-CoA dioxygenase PhyH
MIDVLGRLGATSERRHYQARGYQIYRSAFPAGEVERMAAMVRQQIPVHGGKLRRQDGEFAENDFFPGTQLIRNSLLHPHISLPDSLGDLRDSLCRLVTSPAVGERLRKLDGGARHYVIHQSLLFFAAQTTEMHLDSWSVDTVPLGRSHTVWIPFQHLDHRSGIPSVIPWPRTRSVSEKELGLPDTGSRDERYEHYHQALRAKVLKSSPEAVTPLLRMGDFIVWSSLTPHFTLPAQSFPVERLSLQVLVRPAENRWGDFISQPFDKTSLQLVRVNDWFSIRVLT